MDNKKEELKEIVTRFPFVPTVPIGRKEFFVGFLVIGVVAFAFNIGLAFLSGWANFLVAGIFAVVGSYVFATWWTKRFLDIKPDVRVKRFQITLFILILVLNILTYVQTGMLEEMRAYADYVVIHGFYAGGAPEVSDFTTMYGMPVSIARAIFGIPFLLFGLVLFFKKGRNAKTITKDS
ncbi:MAG: hypothetical protein AAB868_00485 [Patescibacteria group bacterium]